MRNDFTQVETAELADSDLDNVAGGIGALGLQVNGVTGTLHTVTGLVDGIVPATQLLDTVLPTVGGAAGSIGGLGL